MNPFTKIVFLCKKHIAYGRAYGLMNSAMFAANALYAEGVPTQTDIVIDANEIDRVVTRDNPSHVVIEALWVTPEKMKELLSIPRHQKRQWVIRLHSKIPFISNEGMAFDWITRYSQLPFPNFTLACNSEEFTDDLDELYPVNTAYLPNIYQPQEYKNIPKHLKKDKKTIDVGCFGAIRPMKNQLIQAVAAVKFANDHELDLRFHINTNRLEMQGCQVLKNLQKFFGGMSNHLLVQHDWMPHEQFIRLVTEMDMGLQVSYTETFNIVAADFVWHMVPMVGSPEIEWLPKMFHADPNSSEDIAKKMSYAWSWTGYLLRRMSKRNLTNYNVNSLKLWKEFLHV